VTNLYLREMVTSDQSLFKRDGNYCNKQELYSFLASHHSHLFSNLSSLEAVGKAPGTQETHTCKVLHTVDSVQR